MTNISRIAEPRLSTVLRTSIKTIDEVLKEFEREFPSERKFTDRIKDLSKIDILSAIELYKELLSRKPDSETLALSISDSRNSFDILDLLKFTTRLIDLGYSNDDKKYLISNLSRSDLRTLNHDYSKKELDLYLRIGKDLIKNERNIARINPSFLYLVTSKPNENDLTKFYDLVKELYTSNDKYHLDKVLANFTEAKDLKNEHIKQLKEILETLPNHPSSTYIDITIKYAKLNPSDQEINFLKTVKGCNPELFEKIFCALHSIKPRTAHNKLLEYATKAYKSSNKELLLSLISLNKVESFNDTHMNFISKYLEETKDPDFHYINLFKSFLRSNPSNRILNLCIESSNAAKTTSKKEDILLSYTILSKLKEVGSINESLEEHIVSIINSLKDSESFNILDFSNGVSFVKLQLFEEEDIKTILDFYLNGILNGTIKNTTYFFKEIQDQIYPEK